jgi:hypothetical protein
MRMKKKEKKKNFRGRIFTLSIAISSVELAYNFSEYMNCPLVRSAILSNELSEFIFK